MKIFFYVVFAIALASCHTSKPSSGISKTSTGNNVIEKSNASHLDGSWQLQMLFASENKWAKVPVLNFNLKDNTFSGNSGCNSIRGKFTIKESYMGVDKNIITTKMACVDVNSNSYEKSLLSALLKINRYSINKDELELYQGEIVLMKFKRS